MIGGLYEAGVFTIIQVLELQDIDIEAVSCDLLGLSKLKCADFIAQAQTAEKTSRPGKIDYRAEENPYHARYGEHDWMKQIKKSVYLSKYACIIHNDPLQEMALTRGDLSPGDCVSCDQYVCYNPRGRNYHTAGKERETDKFSGAYHRCARLSK